MNHESSPVDRFPLLTDMGRALPDVAEALADAGRAARVLVSVLSRPVDADALEGTKPLMIEYRRVGELPRGR